MHANAIPKILLLAWGALLMQAAEPVDPEFVKALSTSIRGMFAVQIDRFPPQKIETEFRKAVNDSKLTSNEGFLVNLMFVVRKKDIIALRPDVQNALRNIEMKPLAEISTLKTLYALGDDRDRAIVDEQFARRLFDELRNAPAAPGPYLAAAEKIGGVKTKAVLDAALPQAAARQQDAERSEPGNHVRIGQLDKIRMSIQVQAVTLSRKQAALALAPAQRDVELEKLYLRKAGGLAPWAYRELVRLHSPQTPGTLRAFVAQDLGSILPASGVTPEARASSVEQARLRTAILLQDIKAPLLPDEQKLLEQDAATIAQSPEAFRPDWEAVLDHD
jgi:hypothetical protein